MLDFETIIASRTKTAFTIGELIVPANSLSAALVAYVDPAIFHYHSEQPENFFLSGTCFKFRFSERYFAVLSLHQLSNLEVDGDQFALMTRDKKRMVTAEKMTFSDGADFDLLLFEFSEPVKSGSLDQNWWAAQQRELFEPTPAALRTCCIGYPGERNFIDYDRSAYASKPMAIWGNMHEPAMNDRLSFRPLPIDLESPAGMSGSPVFGIRINQDKPECFWAGILTNASAEIFNFIPAARIGEMLAWNSSEIRGTK